MKFYDVVYMKYDEVCEMAFTLTRMESFEFFVRRI